MLQRQPDEVQQFLLKTSILERVSAPLCDVLLAGDEEQSLLSDSRSQEILGYLDANNLFLVPLDQRRHWYRYHRLFADLLKLRLQQTLPAQLSELHRRAASWYQAHDETAEAINHLLAAGEIESAASLVASSAETVVMRGEVMTLLRWVDALPQAAVAERALLALLYAWALLLGGRPANEMEYWLERVEEDEAKAQWTGAIRGYVQLFQGELKSASRLAKGTLATLPTDAMFLRQLATLVHDMAARYQDNQPDSEKVLAEASPASSAAENILVAVLRLCLRADLAVRQGDLATAQTIYERALRQAKSEGDRAWPVASEPLLGLAGLALEQHLRQARRE